MMHKFKGKIRKGNGTMILGTWIMVLCVIIVCGFSQVASARMQATDAQTVADSIADGVAAYMSSNSGSYKKACKRADEILELYNDDDEYSYTIDKDEYSEGKVAVTVTKTVKAGNVETTVSRNTTTTMGYVVGEGVAGVLQWAEQTSNNDSIYYVYGTSGPSTYDCSGFVGQALREAGILSTKGSYERIFSTGDMGSILTNNGFEDITGKVDLSTGDGLQPGDILVRPGVHTEIYYGNGQEIGAHASPGHRYTKATSIGIRSYTTGAYWKKAYRYTGGN